MSLLLLRSELQAYNNPIKAKILARFFKTAKGEYGYGDKFLGLTVPQSRKLAKKYKNLSFLDIKELLVSTIHEERLIGLLILVHNFKKGTDGERLKIFNYYLAHTQYINNWDLVDLSADKIVGEYLVEFCHPELARLASKRVSGSSKNEMLKPFGSAQGTAVQHDDKEIDVIKFDNPVLNKLANSQNLWKRRIAMIATYAFIKKGIATPALAIAEILINDKHDLIHKAVGWMLREVGKRCSQEHEEEFLKKYYKTMPRTMLRYAIERFEIEKRKKYLAGSI